MEHVSTCSQQHVTHVLRFTTAFMEVGTNGRTALHSLTLCIFLLACTSQVHYICLGEFSRSMLHSSRFAAGIVDLFACCPNSFFPESGLGCGRTALCSLISVCCGLLSTFQGVRRCFFSSLLSLQSKVQLRAPLAL